MAPPAAGSSYVGPGDLGISFTYWGGFRAYSAATVGTKAVQLKRASDNATQDINTLADGSFDAASAATFCNATTCVVSKLYDKVGANDMSGAIAPDYIANGGPSSLPVMTMTSNSKQLSGTAALSTITASSLYTVTNRVTGTGVIHMLDLPAAGSNVRLSKVSGAAQVSLIGATGTITATETDAAWHLTIGVSNGLSSVLTVDSTDTTGTITQLINSSTSQLAGIGTTAFRWAEVAWVNNVAWSGGDRTALHTNVSAFWGTP